MATGVGTGKSEGDGVLQPFAARDKSKQDKPARRRQEIFMILSLRSPAGYQSPPQEQQLYADACSFRIKVRCRFRT
jgi:hypothetical protein